MSKATDDLAWVKNDIITTLEPQQVKRVLGMTYEICDIVNRELGMMALALAVANIQVDLEKAELQS